MNSDIFNVRIYLILKNIFWFLALTFSGLMLGMYVTSEFYAEYDHLTQWLDVLNIATGFFFITILLKFIFTTYKMERLPILKRDESFLSICRYSFSWFNSKMKFFLGFFLTPLLIKEEMRYLAEPSPISVSDNFAERMYLYEQYNTYSHDVFVLMFNFTLLLFISYFIVKYFVKDEVFADKLILKKKYTNYQRSVLNDIFKMGSKNTSIPHTLKMLYLKPEYVNQFKVSSLSVKTEQTESSNNRIHTIEFTFEDQKTGLLLGNFEIKAIGEVHKGKERINTLPYKLIISKNKGIKAKKPDQLLVGSNHPSYLESIAKLNKEDEKSTESNTVKKVNRKHPRKRKRKNRYK